MCGYDQIFLAEGAPAIGEVRRVELALQFVGVKGNPPILKLLDTGV